MLRQKCVILTGVGERKRWMVRVWAEAVCGRGRALPLGERRGQQQRRGGQVRAGQVRAAQTLAGHAVLRQELIQVHVLKHAKLPLARSPAAERRHNYQPTRTHSKQRIAIINPTLSYIRKCHSTI